jgi:hypothetical protein
MRRSQVRILLGLLTRWSTDQPSGTVAGIVTWKISPRGEVRLPGRRGSVAPTGRAPALHAGCCRFKSCQIHWVPGCGRGTLAGSATDLVRSSAEFPTRERPTEGDNGTVEGSLSGLERCPAKALDGESRLVGSNPTLSAGESKMYPRPVALARREAGTLTLNNFTAWACSSGGRAARKRWGGVLRGLRMHRMALVGSVGKRVSELSSRRGFESRHVHYTCRCSFNW